MNSTKKAVFALAVFVVGITAGARVFADPVAGAPVRAQAQQPAAQNAAKQVVGAIKVIKGNTLTLTLDTGLDVSVVIQDSVRIVRVAPGQTDLKNAAQTQLSELQVGDRILVRGALSGDGQTLVASSVIAMKRSDVEAKQQHDREDWQKRGIGGLVSASDADAGTITISAAAQGGTKTIGIHTTKDTVIRRYAPDSVQFDDAKPSSLSQIKPGDQLRARGTRGADGSEFAAEEIVSGVFRNIAGTINNVDAAGSTLTVMDLSTKKPVLVKISAQSQVLKLPPQMAQGIAVQLKGAPRGAASGTGAGRAGGAPESAPQGGNLRPGGAGGGPRAGGAPADLQQALNRAPKATLADLQKGDAVMIVSTEGTSSGGVTAIMLVGGVEPILQASPSGQSMTLSPWNLGGGGEDAGEANP
jgi:hypothetical protein